MKFFHREERSFCFLLLQSFKLQKTPAFYRLQSCFSTCQTVPERTVLSAELTFCIKKESHPFYFGQQSSSHRACDVCSPPFTFTTYLQLVMHVEPAPLNSVTQLSPQPCIPPSMLSLLTAHHALFTDKLKYQAQSESCMLRQLNRGGAVTTAESVCHSVRTFFFPIVPRQCSCLNERD